MPKQHWLDEQDGLIIEGDILDSLALLEDESVEAIVTDPPYELGFMGKEWDKQGVSFRAETWEACLRVLKPGGHIVVFGGTRTHHRMWCAIEDAGFEVREMLLWLYGQGMPKSQDVSKAMDKAAGVKREVTGTKRSKGGNNFDAFRNGEEREDRPPSHGRKEMPVTAPATDDAKKWDGWGTGLKPSVEPILLARKPLTENTVAANVQRYGTGALNIDATRNAYLNEADKASATPQGKVTTKIEGVGAEPDAARNLERHEIARPEQKGRWPANVIIQCVCDDPQPVPETASERQGEPSQEQRYTDEGATDLASKPGVRREGGGYAHQPDCPAGLLDAQTGTLKSGMMKAGQKRQRSKGEGGYHGNMPDEATAVGTYGDAGGASRFFYCPKATKKERGPNNTHPTVKPLALMRWLIRLVTPPDGVVLDPFCGSGSTLVAAADEDVGFIGVDVSGEYCAIARTRLEGRTS